MTSNAGEGSRILGKLRSADGTGVVRIEDRYDSDVEDLWTALTDPGRLARWWGNVDGDLRQDGEFGVTGGDTESLGRVDACEPTRLLRVTLRETDESYRKGEGVSPFDEKVQATLTVDGDETVLVIEVQGIPLDVVAFYGVGWQIHAENLAAHLAGRDRGDTEARWRDLIPPYQDLASGLIEPPV